MSTLKLLAYPLNSFIGSITRLAYSLSAIGTLYFSFRFFAPGATLFGASFEHCLMVFLFYQSCFYFVTIFGFTGDMLTKQIQYGLLDSLIVKPFPLFFVIVFQEIRSHNVFTFLTSLLFLPAGFFLLSIHLSFSEICAAIGLFCISNVLLVFFTLLFISGAFFFEGFARNTGWFLDMSSQLVRYPKTMYPLFMQLLFLPMFYVTSPVFDLLQHRFTFIDFILQISVTLLVVICTLLLWRKGLMEYSSAN